MTAEDGNLGQGTWQPGEPPATPPPWPPQQWPPQPPKKKRPRWFYPVVGSGAGVLLVVVFLVVAAIVGAHESAQSASPGSHPPVAQVQLPVTADALFSKLTKDIQDKNESAFLSLTAPAARQAIRSWWANQAALGFTTGAIVPATDDDQVNLDGSGDGTLTVFAGTHNAFDPVGSDGLPGVPSEQYQVGLHFSSQTAVGEITSWQPLDNAPWDQGVQLYVRKAAHVVVAGDPDDSALVNQTLPLAEAAAQYDVKLLDNINPKILHQSGFVVFVSNHAATRDAWFRSGPQPRGWSGDAFGGLTFPLTGANADYSSITSKISSDPVGGARVIIVPYQQVGETPHTETAVLVHEFIHDILFPDDNGFYSSSTAVPAWANEGIAVAVQDLYLQDTNPAPATYHFGVLTHAIEGLPASYRTGRVPSTQQIYDESQQVGYDWYQVAGSAYEYIALKYGMGQMFAAAVLLTTNDTTPFGNVLASDKSGNLTFYSASSIESGWQGWLAGM